MRTSVSNDMTTFIPQTIHIIGAMTDTGAQTLDKMGKIILILFMFNLVSWAKTNSWEKQGDGNFNHISHYEYKYVQLPNKYVLYTLYIFLQLQGMGSNNIFYKIHTDNRTVHKTCLTKYCATIIHRATG